MSIDFATLQGLSIPEGTVAQIADASGRVLWELYKPPVVLEVAKITSDTYAGETTYTGEEFILLDIYPKSKNSVVNVTYGGLTKTLTFSGTNAQAVYFGTFNGVADSVATPSSGTLMIEGGYANFAAGSYKMEGKLSTSTHYCGCITKVVDFGAVKTLARSAFRACTGLRSIDFPDGITRINDYTFYGCTSLALTSLPSGITSIGTYAFYGCTSLALTSLPSGITSIGTYAFQGCTSLALTSLPSGITSIGTYAFYGCTSLALTSLPSGITSIGTYAFYGCTSLALTSLPSGITSIGTYAFYGCTSLALTSLPSGITSIEAYTFYGCLKLNVQEIPHGVVTIAEYAFAVCSVAERTSTVMYDGTLILPSTVTDIGDHAFCCTNDIEVDTSSSLTNGWVSARYLGKVRCLSTTPPTIYHDRNSDKGTEETSFGGNGERVCYPTFEVPVGCGDIYKSVAGWSRMGNYIQEMV